MTLEIPVEVCRPGVTLPRYANPTDGGMDVACAETITIPAGATVMAPTGLKTAVPEGWMLLVFPRSGLSAKTGLRVANSPGLIDAGYRDEIRVLLHNTGAGAVTVNAGDRIAQFVLVQRTAIQFTAVEAVALIGVDRGGGFGSTGA
jgi:dUTP pyrophosphatase